MGAGGGGGGGNLVFFLCPGFWLSQVGRPGSSLIYISIGIAYHMPGSHAKGGEGGQYIFRTSFLLSLRHTLSIRGRGWGGLDP